MTNPLASALGRLAKGKRKTMSRAAVQQRKTAAKRPRPNRRKQQ